MIGSCLVILLFQLMLSDRELPLIESVMGHAVTASVVAHSGDAARSSAAGRRARCMEFKNEFVFLRRGGAGSSPRCELDAAPAGPHLASRDIAALSINGVQCKTLHCCSWTQDHPRATACLRCCSRAVRARLPSRASASCVARAASVAPATVELSPLPDVTRSSRQASTSTSVLHETWAPDAIFRAAPRGVYAP